MKKFKRLISCLLTIVLLLSQTSIQIFAADGEKSEGKNNKTVISVESKNAIPGGKVDVNVLIKNNPGILGGTLEFTFDKSLTLVKASNGETFSYLTMTKPGKFNSPCRFIWDGQECKDENIKDGTILTLTFEVSEDAETKKSFPIGVEVVNNDFYDKNLEQIEVSTEEGAITPLDFTPGDVNDDGKIDITDVILVRRYILGGYNVKINENAANVNDDGKVNSADVILLRRYIAGGYGVELKVPTVLPCNHTMEKTEYKAPTCTEEGNIKYWYCTTCKKYFSDSFGNHEISLDSTVVAATGHSVVIDKAVEPTYTSTGLTEGSHCSVCGTVLKKQEEIPVLKKESYNITYRIIDNDPYLAGLKIENPNPDTYTKEDGVKELKQPEGANGYDFEGWYTEKSGGNKVTEIPAGSSGNKTLYAHWKKVTYTIHFDSPDVPVDDMYYTVDSGKTLTSPSWYGYTFVGWSNDDGFIVSRILPGTYGSITLHANWTSNRNRATSYSSYEQPSIIEDDVNGQFLFIYDIGKIDNVPLSQIEYIGNTQKLSVDNDYEITKRIDSENAQRIANMVSNATTRSSSWTLSKEWNSIYTTAEETGEKQSKTDTRTDSEGNTVGGKYFVSNSSGGSTYTSTESGGSNSNSSKVTTDKSVGINQSYDKSTNKYVDAKLGVSNSTEVSAGVEVPVKIAKVSAGVKNTTTVSAEVSSGRKDDTAYHSDRQVSGYIGTVNNSDSSSYYKTEANKSSTWNSNSGYEKSYQTSRNTEISSAISREISKKTSYSLSESLGGQDSKTEMVGGTDTRSNEYSTVFTYSEGNTNTTKKHITFSSDRPGYYRLVNAGTVHVYGVVGYDVATNSYYTETYNVLDDERHEYLDYSKDNANFDDCENGLVTFEIPYEVNEYIAGVTGKTDGLVYDLNGNVKGFEQNDNFDGTVTIPQYYSVDNMDDTKSAYKVREFDANTFRGNTSIKTVILPMYITEIPDYAFEGCTSLETVIAYGVTKIGTNAFKGCTSLQKFSIDNKVVSIGEKAFEDVPEVAIYAANNQVADATIYSGAKKITTNISAISDGFDNRDIVVSNEAEYFALIGNGSKYQNLQIKSNAAETFINNISFINNKNIPLNLSSSKVTLNRVNVTDSPDFALVLTSDNTELSLYGNISLSSVGSNTAITKNVTLSKAKNEVDSSLNVSGNYFICGEISNEKMLNVTNGEIKQINEDEFNGILNPITVTFDTDGGILSDKTKTVKFAKKYGELPTPEKDGYAFLGWYTAKEGGTQVKEDTAVSAYGNHTLYAKWEWKPYILTFNANGGTVSEASRTMAGNQKIGTLPIPTRDYYDFDAWYTEPTGGTKVMESTTINEDTTIYAHWNQHEPSGWVRESEVPQGAQIADTKWTYTQREYAESGNDWLDGYVKYNTVRTGWGPPQGPIGWDPTNGARNVWSENYIASSNYKTVYHYYRYSTGQYAKGGSDKATSTYGRNYYQYDLDSQLTQAGTQGNYSRGYRYYYSSNYITVWPCADFTSSVWVSDNWATRWYYQEPIYTYYFYRDVNKEAWSDPSSQKDVSNVIKYVKYRVK